MEKYLGNFTKLNQMVHPTLIADSELTELYNMSIAKEGEVGTLVARKGTTLNFSVNSIVDTQLLGAYEFDKDGTIVNVFISKNKIYVYNRVSQTVAILVVTPDIEELDNCLRINNDDILLLCNREPMIVANIFSTPVLRSFNIPAPDISNVDVVASGSSQSMSVAYVLTYYTADGTESVPSQKFGVWLMGNVANRTLKNLPVPTDERIVGKRLYRTQTQLGGAVDVGGIFYHCADIPKEATEWQDIFNDEGLNYGKVLDYVAVIKSARVGAIHRNRLFLGNISIADFNPYKFMYYKTYSNYTTWENNGKVGLLSGITVPLDIGNYTHYDISAKYSTTGYPPNSYHRYRIYLKTADGIYSDYYYDFVFEYVGALECHITLNPPLWTATLGAGLTQYPDFRFIEVYRCNDASNPTMGALLDSFEMSPSVYSSKYVYDLSDNYTYVPLPTVTSNNSPVTYPSAVFYSEAGELGKILVGNRFMIPEEGGQITKILSETDGVVIAKDSSRHKIFTETVPSAWRIYKISEIGITHPHYASNNAGRYYYYDGKHIRTNDDSIISFDVIKYLKELTNNYESFKVMATDKYVLVIVVKRNQYGIATLDLLIYNITYQTWERWHFNNYKQTTVMQLLQNDAGYDFVPVFSNMFNDYIIVPQYYDDPYDIYGTNANVSIDTLVATKMFSEGQYTFRLYKIITDIELNNGDYSIIVNDNIIGTTNNSGIIKTLINDASSIKKLREFTIKIIGTKVKKIKGIKIIYNLIRGLYGE